MAFVVNRQQIPLVLSYATTFNGCQGLTVKKLALDLRRPVFSHGQLYLAATRVPDAESVKVTTVHQQGTLYGGNCYFSNNVLYLMSDDVRISARASGPVLLRIAPASLQLLIAALIRLPHTLQHTPDLSRTHDTPLTTSQPFTTLLGTNPTSWSPDQPLDHSRHRTLSNVLSTRSALTYTHWIS
jgi:hypothetical protein